MAPKPNPTAKKKKGKSAPAQNFGKPSKDEVFEFEIPEGSDGIIPPGDYEGRLVGLNKQISKNSGNPMWVWNFVITKGPHAGMDFPVFTSLTQNALWKLTETLAGLGLPHESGEKAKFSKSDAIGRMAILRIVTGNYQGKDRSEIQTLLPHPKGAGYKKPGTTGNPFADAQIDEEDEDEESMPDDEVEEEEEEEEEDEDQDEDEDEEEDDDDEDEDEDEDEEEDDEDDEDEEEAPPPKRPRPSRAATGRKKPGSR